MPEPRRLTANVALQTDGRKGFRTVGSENVDVTDFLALPADEVRGLLRDFDGDQTPYLENLPGREAAALSAAHGGPTECRVEFLPFLEKLEACGRDASPRDTGWLDEAVMEKARRAAGYAPPGPDDFVSAAFEIGDEHVAVRLEDGAWRHAGAFRMEAEAQEAAGREPPRPGR